MGKNISSAPFFRILLIDGYIDEPGCLGVPPFLAPLPRYIAGAIQLAEEIGNIQSEFLYRTIDQFRSHKIELLQSQIDIVIFLSGVSVPGKYLGGTPISFRELRDFSTLFQNSFSILCGPATKYGIGEGGGQVSRQTENLRLNFNLILYDDAEWALFKLFSQYLETLTKTIQEIRNNQNNRNKQRKQNKQSFMRFQADQNLKTSQTLQTLEKIRRPSIHSIHAFATRGPSRLIHQHPNFKQEPEGNLICEIETFQGCPRYRTGGCRFCIEPLKGPTQHRKIDDVVEEIYELYKTGVRHFRLGAQTDFYSFHHGKYLHPKYPKPNPAAIQKLLSQIWEKCPDLKTLHIDNVNALNFSLYPNEAIEITKLIVEYCTEGNIAAIGVESVDPTVIRANNLKATADEIENAIAVINQFGSKIGKNGNALFLPGLNFIMGLPGESNESLQQNYEFLQKILKKGYLVRRINLRKFLVPFTMDPSTQKWVLKHVKKFQSKYFHWKADIRINIDIPLLKGLYPFGRILKQVYAEKHDGNGTLARQIGTYPIRCFIPKKIPLYRFYDLVVVNHGSRSLVCLVLPVDLTNLSKKELEAINGIGKNRAQAIQLKNPKTEKDWSQMDEKIREIRRILNKNN
ncbi:radical SAM protein [Candidatus Harpocratesius sp.]